MQLVLAFVILALGYLLFWPILLDPQRQQVAEPPALTGPLAPNDRLSSAQLLTLPEGRIGPEDIAVLDGVIHTTDDEGHLYRLDAETGTWEEVANLGGRPLGLDEGPDGNLYIADSYRGIMRWSAEAGLILLTDQVERDPLIYANQLDVAKDGTVYFSNSSDRFDPQTLGGTKPTSIMTVWEQSDTGYVARLNPDGSTERLADGFVYTNGVALSPDEDFLLIAETGRARLIKLWIDEGRFGTSEVIIDSLPGYPDNIEPVGDGTYWIALASPRLPSEALMPYPFLRKVIWRLGPMARPAPVHHGRILRVDGDGTILDMLEDPIGQLGVTTGARVVGDWLYVTSLDMPHAGRVPAPE